VKAESLRGVLLPKLVAISIAVLPLMTLAFVGSSSGTHDATVSMIPVNSKAGENIGYTLTATNTSGDNIDNATLEIPLDEGGNARYRVATPVPAPENWTSELPDNDGFGYARKIRWWTDNAWAHIAAGESENFTFTTTTPLYDGVYTWTCKTEDINGYVDSNSITTRVDNMPPGSPTLVWPDNDENINDNTPNFDWNPVTDPSTPVTYDLTVTYDQNFEWWGANWMKRRPITISGSHPENYQIKIVIPYDNNMRSDYGDLRFLENKAAGVLSYWIENYTADNVTVWVRRLENADNTIYVYYSNPSATSAENADATFLLYDDFLGTSVDTNKWDVVTSGTGEVSVSGSELKLKVNADADDAKIEAKSAYTFGPYNILWEARIRSEEGNGGGYAGLHDTNQCAKWYYRWGPYTFYASENPLGFSSYNVGFPGTNYRIWKFWMISSSSIRFWMDESSWDKTDYIPTVGMKPWIEAQWPAGWSASAWSSYTDWIRVRKYIDPEPTCTVGEEDVINQTGITEDNYQITTGLVDGIWYWKVRARDNAGNIGPWSSPRHFRVDITPPLPPTLVWPTDGENINDNTPNLDWNPVTDPSTPVTYDLKDASWWDIDWTKRRPITISGSHPENYQLKIVIPYDSDMRSDYGDLRFLENENAGELSYWLEDKAADNCTAWVRRLENTDNTFYVYYSNPNVTTTSDISSTFIYGIDWTAQTPLPPNWTLVNATVSFSTTDGLIATMGAVNSWNKGLYLNDRTFAAPFSVKTVWMITGYGYGWAAGLTTAPTNTNVFGGNGNLFNCRQADSPSRWGIEPVANGTVSTGSYGGTSALNTLYNVEAIYKTGNAQELIYDSTLAVTRADTTQFAVYLSYGGWNADAVFKIKQTAVRKYVSPEPTTTVGPENVSKTRITDDNYQIIIELAEGVWCWKVRAVDNVGNIGPWSSLWSFRVDITPPSIPNLLAPADNTKTYDNTPTFRWTAITTENSLPITYDLQVDNDNNFLSPEINVTGLFDNTYTPPFELANGNYFWRARARDNAGNVCPWSQPWSLLINSTPHDATVALIPINSKPGISIDYTLTVTDNATGDNIDNVTLKVPLDENGNALYRVVGLIPAPTGWTSVVPEIDNLGYARKIRWWTDNTWAHIAAGESRNFTFTATTPLYDGVYTWMCGTKDVINYVDNDNFTTRVDNWTLGVLIRAGPNAFDNTIPANPPKYVSYDMGSNPPLAAAQGVGSGAVFAAGLTADLDNVRWDNPSNPYGSTLDELLDSVFQWMVPGADNVLWFSGFGTFMGTRVLTIKGALAAKGYSIVVDNLGNDITTAKLAPYDILVMPGMQLGARWSGGDPSLLPDNNVAAIDSWVRAGGGLAIFNNMDFSGYNFYRLHNKILKKLGFNWRFQCDSVYDNVDNWGGAAYYLKAKVEDNGPGSVYRLVTGYENIGVYSPTSLVLTPTWSVDVSISPGAQSGIPLITLTYTVTVTNTGTAWDNYILTVDNTQTWPITFDTSRLYVPAGENRARTLSVSIPDNTPFCIFDYITVTATSTESLDPTIKDNATCGAHCTDGFEVEVVSITPESQDGGIYTTVAASVVVRNRGPFFPDNLNLSVSDALGWGLSLDNTRFVDVPPGESRTTTLRVTVPGTALPLQTDEITVRVTSEADPMRFDENKCWVTATAWTGTASFTFEYRGIDGTIYKLNLYKDNLWVYQGSKLVVKFYKYDNSTPDGENVIHENFSLPWHVVPENENVYRPPGFPCGIKIARFVLTDNTGNVLGPEIASFWMGKPELFARYVEIKRQYVIIPPENIVLRSRMFSELTCIKKQYPQTY